MVWKGVIIKESLDDESILKMVKIIKSRKTTLEKETEKGMMTFLCIELKDEDEKTFKNMAKSSIKGSFYMHIVRKNNIIIIFRNKVFEFSSEDTDKIKEARDYGSSIGILREQMPFEELIRNPYH